MRIKAWAANKQSLEIQGVSKGIYLKFPNVTKMFFVKPLVVNNQSCKLNLGAQFNYKTGFIPQRVISRHNGRKTNFRELDGVRIWLQFQDISNKTLRSMVGDPEFLQWLQKEPLEQRRGVEYSPPHTLHDGSTREAEREGIQDQVIPTDNTRHRRPRIRMNGEPGEAYINSAVL